jgi:hypothetical protein
MQRGAPDCPAMSPLALLLAAFGVGSLVTALVALVLAIRLRQRTTRILLALAVPVFILPAVYILPVFLPDLLDGRFRTYRAFHRSLHPGMTRAEVWKAMDRHYPGHGPRRRPKTIADTPAVLQFFMDPETRTEPNCEGIFLTLTNDRVLRVDYSAD